jgi:BCD family chlorophyll transporter-like MFS transporter
LASDVDNNRTKWIILGMLILALGANLATFSLSIFESSYMLALILSIIAYALIGIGVGASGTSLLALMAKHTQERRRPAAAMITWLMMIFGIAMTAGLVGQLIAPYSHARLTNVVLGLTAITIGLTCLATWRIERGLVSVQKKQQSSTSLISELKDVWAHDETRKFTIFVFLSMTAYFMQELILEPYAGLVFAYTPSQTTSLSGLQNAGVFCGMLCVGNWHHAHLGANGLRGFRIHADRDYDPWANSTDDTIRVCSCWLGHIQWHVRRCRNRINDDIGR